MKAIIEIPRGDTRRRHKRYENDEMIDLGAISDVIPVNGGVMPVHYGYIKDTKNTDEDPAEEVDVLIPSKESFVVGDEISLRIIAMLIREDGDHKVVATHKDDKKEWEDIPETEKELLIDYFGYKSKITEVKGSHEAQMFVERMRVKG